ncbi:copper homeostasis protein CutC [Vibrio sp.]|nr:copper homeostasis protein CutC [Vibrio sp.]
MKKITLEVCIDNIESLYTAMAAGADRIELCSSLALGGLTPSFGLIKKALDVSSIPIYVMIRPRAGDFVFNDDEIDLMEEEIAFYRDLGVAGVVIGALNSDATINQEALTRFMQAAGTIGVTFHRAFDLVADPLLSLDILIKHHVERILTSGQKETAYIGIGIIEELHIHSKGRISIMAGAGINASNVLELLTTGITEVHLSGKTSRASLMKKVDSAVSMGSDSEDDKVDVASFDKIYHVSILLPIS